MKASKIFEAAAKAKGVRGKFSAKKIDKGWERFANGMKSIQTDKSYVKAGLLAGKAGKRRRKQPGEQGTPPTNVEIGVAHEFGSGHIPARPFIRPAFARHRAEYLSMLALFVKAHVMTGKRPYVKVLGLIGQRMAADMKNYVTRGPQIPPPNSGYPDTERGYWAEKVRKGYHKLAAKHAGFEATFARRTETNAKRTAKYEKRMAKYEVDLARVKAGKSRRKKPLKPPKALKLTRMPRPVMLGPVMPPRTLVDTGMMVNSITYGVVARSTGDLRKRGVK